MPTENGPIFPIVRAKYIALVPGTTGVGFLSQAMQLHVVGVSFCSLAIGVGIINRLGALGHDSPERAQRILSTAFTAQLATCATLGCWSRSRSRASWRRSRSA